MGYAYVKVKTSAGERPIQLTAVPLTIGRHESNRLPIDDHMASRFHCVIEPSPEGYVLHDLQSRNGTLLNGVRVMSSPLKTGDVITIGEVTLTVTIHPTAPSAPKSAALDQGALDQLEVIDDVNTGTKPEEAKRAPAQILLTTANNMLEKDFPVDAITLIDVRGQVLHDARDAKDAHTGDTVLLTRLILLICFRSYATDIHLEPRNDDFLLRIRMDGNLIDIAHFAREVGSRIVALIKILCQLDTTQRHIVQEGHFAATAPGKVPPSARPGAASTARRVDYRVSFVPSLNGQKLVVRVFDTANAPTLMNDLMLPRHALDTVSEELNKDSGLLLVCGPTGSGKTTTLYALLRSCGSSFRNIVTIEDPVEVQIPGVTQLPVDEANGNTFPALLRSVLRQDPDVIMVGEIRDAETARIALQASMTGHLVLSTVHTRDTVGTVYRLLDLGIEPYMVAQGLHLVLAQRLVRKLCTSCKRAYVPTPDDRQRLGKIAATIPRIFAPVGCPQCLGTGFHNRRAFFEFLVTSDQFRDHILKAPAPTEMYALLDPDFVRLQDHGYQLVAQGVTSIDEIDRAVGR